MRSNSHFIFVDEAGDPGKPYRKDSKGNKIPTGASLFYILSAVCIDSEKMFLVENKILETKKKFGYEKEIKSTDVSLPLYKSLLRIINELEIEIYYRLINKKTYRGTFAVDGNRKLHNVFDEYNLAKLVLFAVVKSKLTNVEVIIDRADRRMLDRNFESFNNYLKSKVNTKTIQRVSHITHVDSQYVNVMQLSDLVSGAIKDAFTKKNTELKKAIKIKFLKKMC
ncbi:DUF3800 domain-containing protein [Patescibacteria group bacterium AH-259-L07]|nr:DUF3800 domain-containing protein [Patescibacteria group bacterium AH-259-L07]